MAAASAFVLTGCTENDLSGGTSLAKESSSAIEFSAKTRNAGATRTTGGAPGNITTASLKTGNHSAGFGVVAYHTNTSAWSTVNTTAIPSFMWNQKVAWNTTNNVWSYTPVKFWPNDFSEGKVDDSQGAGQDNNNAYGSQNGGKVSFFAYAPYVVFPATTANGIYTKNKVSQKDSPDADGIVAMTANDYPGEPQVYYILNNADLNNAVDLLWGVRGNSSGYDLATQTATDAATIGDYNTDLTKQSVGESVNFLFKHALSKIGGHTSTTDLAGLTTGLQVVLDVDNGSLIDGVKTGTAIFGGAKQANTLVTVKSIEIYDLKTAKEKNLPGVTEEKSDLVKEGWFNIATGTWQATALGENSGATYSSAVGSDLPTGVTATGELNADIKETPASLAWSTDKWTFTDATDNPGVTDQPKDVYTNASDVPALVLIPSNTAQHLVVRVEYVVRTYDPNLNAAASGSEGTWTKVTQKITSKLTIPAGALKANTYYKLLLHLGLTSVKFSASVCDWEDAANAGTEGNDNDNANNDKDVYLPSNTLDTATSQADANTETVSSATLAAGTSKTYSVPASGNFTLTVTGLKDSETPTVVKTGAATAASATEAASNSSTVTVNLPANDSEAETQTTTLTISGMKSDGTTPFSMVVTLVQVQKVVTP